MRRGADCWVRRRVAGRTSLGGGGVVAGRRWEELRQEERAEDGERTDKNRPARLLDDDAEPLLFPAKGLLLLLLLLLRLSRNCNAVRTRQKNTPRIQRRRTRRNTDLPTANSSLSFSPSRFHV